MAISPRLKNIEAEEARKRAEAARKKAEAEAARQKAEAEAAQAQAEQAQQEAAQQDAAQQAANEPAKPKQPAQPVQPAQPQRPELSEYEKQRNLDMSAMVMNRATNMAGIEDAYADSRHRTVEHNWDVDKEGNVKKLEDRVYAEMAAQHATGAMQNRDRNPDFVPNQEAFDLSSIRSNEQAVHIAGSLYGEDQRQFLKDYAKYSHQNAEGLYELADSIPGLMAEPVSARGVLRKNGVYDVAGQALDTATMTQAQLAQALRMEPNPAAWEEGYKAYVALFGKPKDKGDLAFMDSADMTKSDYNAEVKEFNAAFHWSEGSTPENEDAYLDQLDRITVHYENPRVVAQLQRDLAYAYTARTGVVPPTAEAVAAAKEQAGAKEPGNVIRVGPQDEPGILDKVKEALLGGGPDGEPKENEGAQEGLVERIAGMAQADAAWRESLEWKEASERSRQAASSYAAAGSEADIGDLGEEEEADEADGGRPAVGRGGGGGVASSYAAAGQEVPPVAPRRPPEAPALDTTAQEEPAEAQGPIYQPDKQKPAKGKQEDAAEVQEEEPPAPTMAYDPAMTDEQALAAYKRGELLDPRNAEQIAWATDDSDVMGLVYGKQGDIDSLASVDYDVPQKYSYYGRSVGAAANAARSLPDGMYEEAVMALGGVVQEINRQIADPDMGVSIPKGENPFEYVLGLPQNEGLLQTVQQVQGAQKQVQAAQVQAGLDEAQARQALLESDLRAIQAGQGTKEGAARLAAAAGNDFIDPSGDETYVRMRRELHTQFFDENGAFWKNGSAAAQEGLNLRTRGAGGAEYREALGQYVVDTLDGYIRAAYQTGLSLGEFLDGSRIEGLYDVIDIAYTQMQVDGRAYGEDVQAQAAMDELATTSVGKLQSAGLGAAHGVVSTAESFAQTAYMALDDLTYEANVQDITDRYMEQYGELGPYMYRKDLTDYLKSGALSAQGAKELSDNMERAQNIFDVGFELDPGFLKAAARMSREETGKVLDDLEETAATLEPDERFLFNAASNVTGNLTQMGLAAVGTVLTGGSALAGTAIGYGVSSYAQHYDENRWVKGYSDDMSKRVAFLQSAAEAAINTAGVGSQTSLLYGDDAFHTMQAAFRSKGALGLTKAMAAHAGREALEEGTEEVVEDLVVGFGFDLLDDEIKALDRGEGFSLSRPLKSITKNLTETDPVALGKELVTDFGVGAVYGGLFSLAGVMKNARAVRRNARMQGSYDSVNLSQQMVAGDLPFTEENIGKVYAALQKDLTDPRFCKWIDSAKNDAVDSRAALAAMMEGVGAPQRISALKAAQRATEYEGKHTAAKEAETKITGRWFDLRARVAEGETDLIPMMESARMQRGKAATAVQDARIAADKAKAEAKENMSAWFKLCLQEAPRIKSGMLKMHADQVAGERMALAMRLVERYEAEQDVLADEAPAAVDERQAARRANVEAVLDAAIAESAQRSEIKIKEGASLADVRTEMELTGETIHDETKKAATEVKTTVQHAFAIMPQTRADLINNNRNTGVANKAEHFSQALDAWDDKTGNLNFVVAKTPEKLKNLGDHSLPDGDIVLNSSKLRVNQTKFHKAMTKDVVKQLPQMLADPVMVMESRTQENRIVVVGELDDANGNPVVAILSLDTETNKVSGLRTIPMVNAYGKDKTKAQNMFSESKYLYLDKKRADAWQVSTGLQLPTEAYQAIDSDNVILAQSEIDVNKDGAIDAVDSGFDGAYATGETDGTAYAELDYSLMNPVIATYGSELMKRSGLKLAMADLGENDLGYFDRKTGTIVVNSRLSVGEQMRSILSHELTHFMEQSTGYERYAKTALDAAYDTMSEAGKARYDKDLADVKAANAAQGRALTDEDARRELVAAATQAVVSGDEEFVRSLLRGGQTRFVGRVYDALSSWGKRYAAKNAGPEAVAAFRQMQETKKALRSLAKETRAYRSGDGGGESHALVGTAPDGRGIYESNFESGTSKDVKRRRVIELWQNVWSKKPIELNIKNEDGSTRRIQANFDPDYDPQNIRMTDLGKVLHSKNGSSGDRTVTLDLADDLYDLVRTSDYYVSEPERGKTSQTHRNVKTWHYFFKDIIYRNDAGETKPYTVWIDLKERDDGGWVYQLYAKKTKEKATPNLPEEISPGNQAASPSEETTHSAGGLNDRNRRDMGVPPSVSLSQDTPNVKSDSVQKNHLNSVNAPAGRIPTGATITGKTVKDRSDGNISLPQGTANVNTDSMQTGPQYATRLRQFGNQTAQTLDYIRDDVKQSLQGTTYESDANDAQIRRAEAKIDSDGTEAAVQMLIGKERGTYSADDNVLALTLMARMDAAGDVTGQALLAARFNEEGTLQGQILQSRKAARRLNAADVLGEAVTKSRKANAKKAGSGEGADLFPVGGGTQSAAAASTDEGVKKTVRRAAEIEAQIETIDRMTTRDNPWKLPLYDWQNKLIELYGLRGVKLAGDTYHHASWEQRMLHAILATRLDAKGDALTALTQQLEAIHRGYAVVTQADMAYIAAQMNEFALEANGTQNDWEMTDAAKVALAKGHDAMANTTPADLMDKVESWRFMNMLSSPVTWMKNVLSNAAYRPLEQISTGVAQATDALVSKKTGVRTTLAADGGARKAGKEAFRAETGRAWRDSFITKADTSHSRKYDLSRDGNGRTYNNAFLDTAQTVIDFAMQAGDRPYFEQCYAEEKAALERLGGRAQTYDAKTGKRHAMTAEEIHKEATARAVERTFQEGGVTVELMNRLSQTPTGAFLARTIVPFIKTPTNIAMRSLDYSPVGLAKALVWDGMRTGFKDGKFDQRQFVMGVGRGLTGTGLLVAGMLLKQAGVLKFGRGDEEDEHIREIQKSTGEPYGAYVEIMGTKHEIEWAMPLSSGLIAGARLAQRLAEADNAGDYATACTTGILCDAVDTLFDNSYLSSVNDLFRGYDDATGVATRFVTTAAESLESQMLSPSILRAVAKWSDPYVRDTSDDNPVLASLKTNVVQNWPVLRQMLPIKADVTGQPMTQGRAYDDGGRFENAALHMLDCFLSPTSTISTKNDETLTELLDLGYRAKAGGESTSFLPGALLGKPEVTITKTLAKKRGYTEAIALDLTAEEMREINERYARTLFDGPGGLRKMTGGRSWARMTDEARIDAVKKAKTEAKNAVLLEVLGEMREEGRL